MATKAQQDTAKKRTKTLLEIVGKESYEEWLHKQHVSFNSQNDNIIEKALEALKNKGVAR